MSIFKGAGVAIVTPMKPDGSIHFEKLAEYVENQITAGTDAIIVNGTTGEAATMSYDEQEEAVKVVVSAAKKRVPVIAGAGSNNTKNAVKLAVNARKAGADAILTVTPFYNKATQKGLKLYYKEVAAAAELPLIMYNVPGRTGCNILPKTAVELSDEVENIVAIKDAAGNISQTMKMAHLNNGNLDIYSGNDDQVIPILSAGGIGVISVLSNVAPKDTHDMVMEYLNGNTKKALELQLKAIPLIDALFCEVNPIPVKTALNLMGKEAGVFRSPMCEMDEKNVEVLKKAMKEYGLLN
ncbi:MAG: 4-hydroxy-tetrahydrodipicolinate synthase [Lachnospiraceae bacterium]|nr:4-hydroxy-tetrahydrodipicolinate synthase [Lachnospiraceae bacterium]